MRAESWTAGRRHRRVIVGACLIMWAWGGALAEDFDPWGGDAGGFAYDDDAMAYGASLWAPEPGGGYGYGAGLRHGPGYASVEPWIGDYGGYPAGTGYDGLPAQGYGYGGYGAVPGHGGHGWPSIPGAGVPWSAPYGGGYPPGMPARSGGNPVMGYWHLSPRTFHYQRLPVGGGPAIYAHGWYTPQGDYEGVLVIRGSRNRMPSLYGR